MALNSNPLEKGKKRGDLEARIRNKFIERPVTNGDMQKSSHFPNEVTGVQILLISHFSFSLLFSFMVATQKKKKDTRSKCHGINPKPATGPFVLILTFYPLNPFPHSIFSSKLYCPQIQI